MHFKICDKKAETFVQIFQHIKLLSDTITLQLNSDKLYVQGTDHGCISIFQININKEWFDEYLFKDNDKNNYEISLYSPIFYKILNTRTDNHCILFEIDKYDQVSLYLNSSNNNDCNKSFNLPLIDVESELMEIPPYNYDLSCTINSKQFKTYIDELSQFGDSIDISHEKELILSTNNNDYASDMGSMKITIKSENLENISKSNEKDNLSYSFSLKKIQSMCQFWKLSKNVTIDFKNNYPMKLQYNLSDQDYVSFYLAPKIED